MTLPIVLSFREGAETYEVNAAGDIGRPAIGMAPSGRWRFDGVAYKAGRAHRFMPFRECVERLARGDMMPAALYVRDVDCGTNREHGAAVAWIKLAPGVDVQSVIDLDRERLATIARKVDAERLERCRLADKGRELWRDSRYPIALVEYGLGAARWIVRDGDEATRQLDATAAASALGFAIMESAQNEESGA